MMLRGYEHAHGGSKFHLADAYQNGNRHDFGNRHDPG